MRSTQKAQEFIWCPILTIKSWNSVDKVPMLVLLVLEDLYESLDSYLFPLSLTELAAVVLNWRVARR